MSIIFGVKTPEGDMVTEQHLLDMGHATDRWAPDGTFVRSQGGIGMGFQPYHTHQRSTLEGQPIVDGLGNMVSLDGRLDNHNELRELLELPDPSTPDSLIVLAAFRKWDEESFTRFVGDWAVAVWLQENRSLYLGRDHAGTRTLFYEISDKQIVWSTVLETFLIKPHFKKLSDAYAIRYLSCFSIQDLTPYSGITAVSPAHYVVFRANAISRKRHWQWMAAEKLLYQKDVEYEEHFLDLFQQSVERRTGFGAPVLAQLSGGMDSSSIVCMSDTLRRSRSALPADLIDTISYFDEAEPNWDEKPYFSLVESLRGKVGVHVDLSRSEYGLGLIPQEAGVCSLWPDDHYASFEQPEVALGFRVVLSGIGGDEMLGGVPTALPELADLLHSRRIRQFVNRSLAWCLCDRTSFIQLVSRVIAYYRSLDLPPTLSMSEIPPWLSLERFGSCDEPDQIGFQEARRNNVPPSSISFGVAWWHLLETLMKHRSIDQQRTEYRYPYLDKDLVTFLQRVPREQLVRPGRRRSLMRRALKEIVPVEVIERRRKAFAIRRPLLSIIENNDAIASLFRRSIAVEKGYIDRESLLSSIEMVTKGADVQWRRHLVRAICLEKWLQSGRHMLGNAI